MKFIIKNDGLLDINELRLVGCSSKNGSDTIGKFGTGLKYAIAVLIRNDVKFDIYIGKHKVIFQKNPIKIRDRQFEQISIDYQTTSITTNLGVEWTNGQGVREFIANCIDEGGEYYAKNYFDDTIMYIDEIKENQTTVIFHNYEDDIEQYMDDFVFDGWNEVCDGYYYQEVKDKAPIKVFKEGFLVHQLEEEGNFIYRIDSIKLNESRRAENIIDARRGIAKIQSLFSKDEVEKIVETKETNAGVYYDIETNLGDGWNDIPVASIKGLGGYDLEDILTEKIEFNKGNSKVNLSRSRGRYVNKDNYDSKYEVYFCGGSDQELDYDVDKQGNIYIFYSAEDGTEGNEIAEMVCEAKEYRKAMIYAKENNLITPEEAIMFLWRKQQKIHSLMSDAQIFRVDANVYQPSKTV